MMATEERWFPTDCDNPDERRPKRGQKIDWIAPNGEVVKGGTFEGGAVWMLPEGLYVYYTPPFWRPHAGAT
jgi:hypothetical protein